VYVSRNDGIYGDRSSYNALQTQFARRVSGGLQLLANYTWAHAIDTASDSVAVVTVDDDPAKTRGNSSFDRRHIFNLSLNYHLPQFNWKSNSVANLLNRIMLKDWSLASSFKAQSGMPGSVTYTALSTSGGNGSLGGLIIGPATSVGMINSGTSVLVYSLEDFRADRVAGKSLYVSDSTAPGGKKLNPAAFAVPACAAAGHGCDGNTARNALAGLGMWQADLAITRDFHLHESCELQFRTELLNAFNHPNFAYSNANLGAFTMLAGTPVFSGDGSSLVVPNVVSAFTPNSLFGIPTQTAGQAQGSSSIRPGTGLNSTFQNGGPRTIQFAMKLTF
jgi:hypothetical protein